MITILVLEDEKKIDTLLVDFLRKEGYSFIDEPESKGLIKIVKKAGEYEKASLSNRVVEIKDNSISGKEGELYKSMLAEIEKPLIESVLEKTEGNQLKTAKILGINRNTLHSKIRKLQIDVGRFKR